MKVATKFLKILNAIKGMTDMGANDLRDTNLMSITRSYLFCFDPVF